MEGYDNSLSLEITYNKKLYTESKYKTKKNDDTFKLHLF